MGSPARNAINTALFWLAIVILLVITLVPIYWLLITGVKLPREAMAKPPILIPSVLTLSNYQAVFRIPGVTRFIGNSLITASTSTVLGMILATMMAYALVRLPLVCILGLYALARPRRSGGHSYGSTPR